MPDERSPEERILEAEAVLEALRDEEVDAVVGSREVMVVRLHEAERKLREAGQKLRESERFIRRVLNSLFSYVGVLEPDGTLVEVNRAPLEVAGIKAGDVIGKKFWDCYWWNYDGDVQEQLRDAVARARGGERVRYDVLIRMAGDRRIWIDFQIAPLRNDENEITHLIPSGMDISRRRLVELDLRESEERFRNMAERMPHFVWLIGVGGDVLYQNHLWDDYTGAVPGTDLEKVWVEQFHPDDRASIEEAPGDAFRFKNQGFLDIEARIRRHDGEYRWFRIQGGPLDTPQGSEPRWLGTGTDIHDQRKTLEAVRDSEQRFREMADTAPAVLWVTNSENGTTFLSYGWYELTGQIPEDGLGEGWLETVHPDDREDSQETIQRAVERREPFQLHCRIRSRTGDYRWAIKVARPRFDESGVFQGHIGAVLDDHERKQAEEALKRAHEELERRVAERTRELHYRAEQLARLTSQLSLTEQRERHRLAEILHDNLQQLLVSAKLRLDVFSRTLSGGSSGEMAELVGIIDDAIEASRSLTFELAPPILHDAGVVAGLAWLGRWMQKQHSLSVAFHMDEHVAIEREEIRILVFQSIRELLFNVLKHAGVETATVEVSMVGDGLLKAIVSDKGAGFDPRMAISPDDGMTGFGLFSIRERTELLGGQFHIESAPGEGARFTLIVPCSQAAHADARGVSTAHAAERAEPRRAPDRSERPHVRQAAGEPIRVLIVDDHHVIRDGLRAVLAGESAMVVVGDAADGLEAIERAHALRPDIVLMDYSMPRMDGVEATRRIKAELPETRIIGLSMYEEPDRAAAMLDAGATAYMTKSGVTGVLLETIQEVWGRPRGRSETSG